MTRVAHNRSTIKFKKTSQKTIHFSWPKWSFGREVGEWRWAQNSTECKSEERRHNRHGERKIDLFALPACMPPLLEKIATHIVDVKVFHPTRCQLSTRNYTTCTNRHESRVVSTHFWQTPSKTIMRRHHCRRDPSSLPTCTLKLSPRRKKSPAYALALRATRALCVLPRPVPG